MIDPELVVSLAREAAVGFVGTALLAATAGLLMAGCYRWLSTRSTPAGIPALLGLTAVAGVLSSGALASGAFLGATPLDHRLSAGYLLGTMLLGGIAATAGGRLGDRIACQVADLERIDANGEAAAAVRSARLAVEITLPKPIATATGYQAVDPAVHRALSGATIRLPHGLTPTARRERLERHIERDYDVGYAAVTLADDGTVDRVHVGRQSTGLRSMVPRGAVAIAIRADPSPDASLGDPVAIWSTDGHTEPELVATGTLRTMTRSIATVIVDATLAAELPADDHYRLLTYPDEPTDGYEFASTLRTVEETVTTLSIDSDGPLVGEFVGWLPGRVLAIERGTDHLPLPADNETLESDDELWVLASPSDLTAFDPAPTDDCPPPRSSI
ncbi:TrkA C-terminal domain-containing protein [Natrialba sp. PRR66]|uniref:TrkA C-terminal domain-containing protein n=1 Tax=Natrialba sp. PRR66 TaxID=3098146 RepID=UPI002B1CEB01|nr:TrkA C-terminal domain-containing protein [Natrialba sp. PRR66]